MSIELFTLTSILSLTYKLGRYKTIDFSLYRCLFGKQSGTVYPYCASPLPQRSHHCIAIGGSSINNHVPFSGEVFYKPCVALCWEWTFFIQENQIFSTGGQMSLGHLPWDRQKVSKASCKYGPKKIKMSINNMIYAYYTLTNFFRQCWNVLIHQTLL